MLIAKTVEHVAIEFSYKITVTVTLRCISWIMRYIDLSYLLKLCCLDLIGLEGHVYRKTGNTEKHITEIELVYLSYLRICKIEIRSCGGPGRVQEIPQNPDPKTYILVYR